MALPNMRSAYLTRRILQEQAIALKREKEAEKRNTWEQNAKYFASTNVKTERAAYWGSDKSFKQSMEAWDKEAQKETKKEMLVRRRARLQSLLQKDREEQEAELAAMYPPTKSGDRLKTMRIRSEELKSQRETHRQEVVGEKFRQQFNENNPELREIDRRLFKDYVNEYQTKQVDERKETEKIVQEEKGRYDAYLKEQQQALEVLDREVKVRHKTKERDYQRELLDQIEELKERDRQAAILREQAEKIIEAQMKLEDDERARTQREKNMAQAKYYKDLHRQQKAALKKRSKEIQEELLLDLQMLDNLRDMEKEDNEVKTARREQALADVEWMKAELQKNLAIEKEREALLHSLYQEEAEKIAIKQEAQWEKEKLARKQLLDSVLRERQEQLHDKLVRVRAQQEASVTERQQLIRDIELLALETERDKERKLNDITSRREELDAQTERKRREAERQKQLDLEEIQRQRWEEEQLEEALRVETERRKQLYVPPTHGRRKIVWD